MHQKLLALGLCLLVFSAAGAAAQEPPSAEPTFNLRHTTVEEQQAAQVAEEVQQVEYEPIIDERTLEASVTLGFWLLDKTLLQHDNIIYKYTDEDTYYGDVAIKGQSAFNPQVRLNYNLFPWFSLEPVFGISVSEYTATVGRPRSLSNQAVGGGRVARGPPGHRRIRRREPLDHHPEHGPERHLLPPRLRQLRQGALASLRAGRLHAHLAQHQLQLYRRERQRLGSQRRRRHQAWSRTSSSASVSRSSSIT
ncbi:MAG: hypothetical protein IPI34_11470 [bacterium]|nr:hypothetical protein [bacterium]